MIEIEAVEEEEPERAAIYIHVPSCNQARSSLVPPANYSEERQHATPLHLPRLNKPPGSNKPPSEAPGSNLIQSHLKIAESKRRHVAQAQARRAGRYVLACRKSLVSRVAERRNLSGSTIDLFVSQCPILHSNLVVR